MQQTVASISRKAPFIAAGKSCPLILYSLLEWNRAMTLHLYTIWTGKLLGCTFLLQPGNMASSMSDYNHQDNLPHYSQQLCANILTLPLDIGAIPCHAFARHSLNSLLSYTTPGVKIGFSRLEGNILGTSLSKLHTKCGMHAFPLHAFPLHAFTVCTSHNFGK